MPSKQIHQLCRPQAVLSDSWHKVKHKNTWVSYQHPHCQVFLSGGWEGPKQLGTSQSRVGSKWQLAVQGRPNPFPCLRKTCADGQGLDSKSQVLELQRTHQGIEELKKPDGALARLCLPRTQPTWGLMGENKTLDFWAEGF